MPGRKTKLSDCNPKWSSKCGITFECPEGHPGCSHTIPFTPSLDNREGKSWQRNGALWHRFGDTFETLTLFPSIRKIPTNKNDCSLHIFIKDGEIEFCSDSR